jgi:aminodeoxyfutalosine synthase
LIRDAGFVPKERNTLYEVIETFEGPDPERRQMPQSIGA